MSRTVLRAAGALAVLIAAAAAPGPSGAQQTGVTGRVEPMLELTLTPIGPSRLDATVTATIAGTQLSMSAAGRPPRVLRDFPRALTRSRVTVAPDGPATSRTITLGPQTP